LSVQIVRDKVKTVIALVLLTAVSMLSFSCAPVASQTDMVFEVPDIMIPLASGNATKEIDYVIIDYSHTYHGYIMVKHIECASVELRVVITKPNEARHIYSLCPEQEFVAFPLSGGDGVYTIEVYKRVEGTQHMELLSASINTVLLTEFKPFLHPNHKVNFYRYCAVVKKAAELTAGMDNAADKISAIGEFIVSNIVYDDDLIETRVSGYIPDVNNVLARGSGLCLDFATLMTAMLRSRSVPAKLVVGNAGGIYHAWLEAHDGEAWRIIDPTIEGGPLSAEKIAEMNYIAEFVY
jgi:hypothetical protein